MNLLRPFVLYTANFAQKRSTWMQKLPALLLGRRNENAPIPTAKHRRFRFVRPHRPDTEFYLYGFGAGGDAASH